MSLTLDHTDHDLTEQNASSCWCVSRELRWHYTTTWSGASILCRGLDHSDCDHTLSWMPPRTGPCTGIKLWYRMRPGGINDHVE